MKVLFFHAKRFGFSVHSESKRLNGASPEGCDVSTLDVIECLVVLFHIEEGDGDCQVKRLIKDIERIANKVGARRLVVAAFGHLSSSYAPIDVAMRISHQIVATCRERGLYEVYTSPFGYNKTFMLDGKGHQDAVKHRSY